MNIPSILSPSAIRTASTAQSKKQALQELARLASQTTQLDEKLVFETLAERERLGSTGFGDGFAIPHGRFDGLNSCHMVFLGLERPIDFDADDDVPVDLLCCVLAPDHSTADPLKALACVSRHMKDESVRDRLRKAESSAMVVDILRDEASDQQRHAA